MEGSIFLRTVVLIGVCLSSMAGRSQDLSVIDDPIRAFMTANDVPGVSLAIIGGNTLSERRAHEVKYYGHDGENPYIYNIRRMDSHGGWIASASDLVQLLVHVDG